MKKCWLLLLLAGVLILPSRVFAKEDNQFIVIVNPVRISSYNPNPAASIAAEYQQIKKRQLPATWLLSFDTITNENVRSIVKDMDKGQELGILMEVSPKFAQYAKVTYSQTDSWHRASSLFLSGYTQEDRIKLIEGVFNKFKDTFGYFPTSVGAWWIDSFSLEFMRKKYGIIANLGVADQFSTDGYQIWGQYWSTPFYPSKYHAGIPANSIENKLDLVTIQWAARDPLNGYGDGQASRFSTQDYFTVNLGNGYFRELVELFAKKHRNNFGQVTVGLEGDLPADIYRGKFSEQIDIVLSMANSEDIQISTMKDFSNWYRESFPSLSPARVIESEDLLGSSKKIIWYQSPYYRVGLVSDPGKMELKMIDFRTYPSNFEEPYYHSPHRSLDLHINIPSVVDEVGNNEQGWKMFDQPVKSVEGDYNQLSLRLESSVVNLREQELNITGQTPSLPTAISSSPVLSLRLSDGNLNLGFQDRWIVDRPGLTVKEIIPEIPYFFKRKRGQMSIYFGLLFMAFLILIVSKLKISSRYKIGVLGSPSLAIAATLLYWLLSSNHRFLVSQSEIDALYRLATLPGNGVIVYDGGCQSCSYHSIYKPAAFANKKDYIRTLSKKNVIYNLSVFNSRSGQEARKELLALRARYIYLMRLEDYEETIPFSPRDLGIEKVYENANAQIWRID